ncbi:hypothetical protein MJD09_14270 [bacterium]|nr:hypothetical protein [bacterium]
MANGDAGSMADIWSHGADVTVMHPIGGRPGRGTGIVRRSSQDCHGWTGLNRVSTHSHHR